MPALASSTWMTRRLKRCGCCRRRNSGRASWCCGHRTGRQCTRTAGANSFANSFEVAACDRSAFTTCGLRTRRCCYSRRSSEGGERASRALRSWLHHARVPARPSGHACSVCQGLRPSLQSHETASEPSRGRTPVSIISSIVRSRRGADEGGFRARSGPISRTSQSK